MPDPVCATLVKPPDCDLANPPLTPDFNPGVWQPNGCGGDNVGSVILDQLTNMNNPLSAGAGLDEPTWGANFKPACDKPDDCWRRGRPKLECDQEFRANLSIACDNTINPACGLFRDGYVAAVLSPVGQKIYDALVAEHACAAWVHQVKEKGCEL